MLLAIPLIFFGALAVGYGIAAKILVWAVAYFHSVYGLTVISLSPVDVIMSILKIDFVLVSATILPILILLAVSYIAPALYAHERRIIRYIPISVVLASLGAVAGYLLSMYYFIPFFQKFANSLGVINQWTVINLVNFIFTNCLIFMITMQVPLVVIILFNIGLLKLQNLTKLRKVVMVLAVVFGAAATPTVDIFSQMLVAVPFYLLFEIALQYCLLKQRFTKKVPDAWPRAAKQAVRKKPAKRKQPAPTVVDVPALPATISLPTVDQAVTPSAPPEPPTDQ